MRIVGTFCLILGLVSSLPLAASAQELNTAQVLVKLDEKAKVFTSLEASISQAQTIAEISPSVPDIGKIYMKVIKSVPTVLLDFTSPKGAAKTILIKDANAKIYFKDSNSYRNNSFDPKNPLMQLLLTGFGVTSETLKKYYNPQVTGRETIDGVSTVVLELPSISTETGEIKKLTLWLDPKTWTPVQTRINQKAPGDFMKVKYTNVKLNKGVSDSVFKINIPKDATKQ